MKSWIRSRGVGVAFAGVVGGLMLGPVQRAMLYPAPPEPREPRLPVGAESVWLESSAGRTELWWLPPLDGAPPASVLLYAHGNAELVDDWGDAFGVVRSWGVGVALVEYPGYGRSGGKPSEASIREVMTRAYDWIEARAGAQAPRMIGYGRSLGGGALGLLLAERRFDALVLESTFTSVVALAKERFVPGFLVMERFETEARLAEFSGPVLVVHGENDSLVPLRHGERLAQIAAQSQLVVFEGCGHNDCPRPWPEIRAFLERYLLVR